MEEDRTSLPTCADLVIPLNPPEDAGMEGCPEKGLLACGMSQKQLVRWLQELPQNNLLSNTEAF